ncbi:MAG TPA: hypothetical protein PK063_14205 [Nitrospira sp.]|nr:hypothetical protein [Nitrospira sp.]
MARSQAMDEWKGALPDSRHGGFQILDKESKEPILYHPIPGAKNTGRMVREQNAGRDGLLKNRPRSICAGSYTQKKAPSSFEDGASKNLQFLYQAFITFPSCVHNISIANSYDLTLSQPPQHGS